MIGTLHSEKHAVKVNGLAINIIDTPEIYDKRYDDETTLSNVTRYLGLCDFSTLHGVCVLLQPNVSRLSAVFEVCFTDLFKMLPRAALKNVVFCFTHTRTQEPDDTIPILRKLLKTSKVDKDVLLSSNTIYCTDIIIIIIIILTIYAAPYAQR